MTPINITATSANNWIERWNLQIPNRPKRLVKDTLVCPILLTSPVVAVMFNSLVASGREWAVAGYLNQQIQTGITIGQSASALTSRGQKLFFNQLQVFVFPISSEYACRLTIDSWVTGAADFTLWEYTGEIT